MAAPVYIPAYSVGGFLFSVPSPAFAFVNLMIYLTSLTHHYEIHSYLSHLIWLSLLSLPGHCPESGFHKNLQSIWNIRKRLVLRDAPWPQSFHLGDNSDVPSACILRRAPAALSLVAHVGNQLTHAPALDFSHFLCSFLSLSTASWNLLPYEEPALKSSVRVHF